MDRLIKDLDLSRDLDFLTGSVHWLDGWGFDHRHEHWAGKDVDDVYRRYFECALDLVETGLYDRVAHPDSIKCFGHRPTYDLAGTYMTLAARAAELGIAFEHNTGLHHRLGLPSLGLEPLFLKTSVAHGVEIVTASDAHRPEDVGLHLAEAQDEVRGVRSEVPHPSPFAASGRATRLTTTE
jgi:histidinol-phosphatase (PHP family)